jgi:hypothetical protein
LISAQHYQQQAESTVDNSPEVTYLSKASLTSNVEDEHTQTLEQVRINSWNTIARGFNNSLEYRRSVYLYLGLTALRDGDPKLFAEALKYLEG